MSPFKIIVGFGVKFLVVYILVLLIAVTTGFNNKVRDFYASSTSSFFNKVISIAEIQTAPVKTEDRNLVYKMLDKKKYKETLRKLRQGNNTNMGIPTVGYETDTDHLLLLPFIFLLSLIVAYPSNFRQKIIPLILGFILLWIYVVFQTGCLLILTIDNSELHFPTYELSSFSRYFLEVMENIFIEISYIYSVLIWVLVCVRLEDFKIKKG